MKFQKGYQKLKVMFHRGFEESLPFIYFYFLAKEKTNKVYEVTWQSLEFYSGLTDVQITNRLEHEHNRAKEIDDKTFKFTLALSVSLSIISAGASGVVKLLPDSNLNPYISFTFFLSSFYMLCGGFISLGSLKTMPKFAYGSYFEMSKNSATLIKAIIGQEKVNMLRYIRNELSYMTLRNGFLLILLALILCLFVLAGAALNQQVELKPMLSYYL